MYFDQILCHKVFSDIVRSVYPGIYHFIFEGMFSQSRTFYENTMILWYYQIRPKVVWKVHGAWIDGYDSQDKDTNIPLRKIRVCYFFRAVYHSKKHMIPHPVIAAIFERHLKYFTTLKNNNNMPVKFSKYNRNLSKIVTSCESDFRLNFALNGSHLGHRLHYVNQTFESFILIVCIIRPLNIDKKSKCFISRFLVS